MTLVPKLAGVINAAKGVFAASMRYARRIRMC
jgi:hypothetical protein